ncbi:hypothetical protein BVRB_8g197400 [Beta vulgaris subsp. vulgaris]|nr:hypothetical protein BVRB_8g197400 [Beta vulgaris subsp. vulgaris]
MATLFSFDGLFDLDEALSMPMDALNSTQVTSPFDNDNDVVVSVTETVLTFPAVVKSNDVVCSVCREDFEPPHHGGRQIPCGHVYHVDCIATWLSVHDSCPLCRVAVVDQNLAHKKFNC